jgi:general secretion pathway protein G
MTVITIISVINLLCCFVSPIIAKHKGFKSLRWVLSFGIIGLVTVLCLPTARAEEITPEEKKRRAHIADITGACMTAASIVVVAILIFVRSTGRAKQGAAFTQIKTFQHALDTFRLDNGRYPTSEEGLQTLVRNPLGSVHWQGPYLKTTEIPRDPWNNPYHYKSPGEHGEYDLFSLGADNQVGGTDENGDIVSW